MAKNRNRMASQVAIYRYWASGDGSKKFEELGIEIGDKHCCFACGWHLKIERSHIISDFHGGSGEEANLHLLCPNCHVESETLNERGYWTWLKNKNIHHFKMEFEWSAIKLELLELDISIASKLAKEKKYEEAAKYLNEP